MDYKETLNLPKTAFPMKANLTQKEPAILRMWDEIQLYRYVRQQRKGKPKFVLHDGPPYSNGHIHIGTALNKVLKDIVIKYKTMRGYDTPYVPGWDTHGLPIEIRVTEMLGEEASRITPLELRKKCEEYALKFVDIQRDEFKRLGVRGDWENPYLTLEPEYEARVLSVLKKLVEDGNVYREKKPIYWCPHCKTALAEAEVEYRDHTSPSIYVKFPMKGEDNTYILIWTTTPWTLPANTGIAVHPDEYYVKVRVGDEYWILAEKLMTAVLEKAKVESFEVVERWKGAELDGKKALHPFMGRDSLIFPADYVVMDTGTGCVHTAPGHGEEDYYYGYKKYGLEVISPVDDAGVFTEEAGKYAGLFIEDANPVIVEDLRKSGMLISSEEISHSYPHCWRCKKPVIFRATPQWFISVDHNGLREKVLKEIERVKWYPHWGATRIRAMVEERPDWCISRQRYWGTPIPAVYCEKCGEAILDSKILEKVIEVVRVEGSNAWYEKPVQVFLPDGFRCPKCGGDSFRKETDTLDVWIDSGASFEGVLVHDEDQKYPCDVYLEGSDQHRGWFQSAIFLSVAMHGIAPYDNVITHGFVKDEQGRAMSKSLGNVVHPEEVISKFGADILRLWVASTDYHDDVRLSMNMLSQHVETYRKIRNTIRFLLGNLYDFDCEKHRIAYDKMLPIDKWALMKLHELIKAVTDAYENHEFYKVYYLINNFCVNDMSAFYLDVVKDRLYVERKDSISRRSAQTVMFEVLTTLIKLLAPILTFTMEEVYSHLPEKFRRYKTVQAETWPEYRNEYVDGTLRREWECILRLRGDVLKALEEARSKKLIGHSLDARVTLYPRNSEARKVVEEMGLMQLADIFIVSQLLLDDVADGYEGEYAKVKVEKAEGRKCARCWKISLHVGEDPEYPDVCPRCAEVLKEGEKR